MQLNGGMTVTEEEVNAMMDDAALDECVAPPPRRPFLVHAVWLPDSAWACEACVRACRRA
jgi:hypothetical protein